MLVSLVAKAILASAGTAVLLSSRATAIPTGVESSAAAVQEQDSFAAEYANRTSSPDFAADRIKPKHLCLKSTFHCEVHDWWSPDIEDCRKLAESFSAGDGEWDFQIGMSRRLGNYRTCCFTGRSRAMGTLYVGGQDVVDVITDSIPRCAEREVVGASGTFSCHIRAVNGFAPFDWVLHHCLTQAVFSG